MVTIFAHKTRTRPRKFEMQLCELPTEDRPQWVQLELRYHCRQWMGRISDYGFCLSTEDCVVTLQLHSQRRWHFLSVPPPIIPRSPVNFLCTAIILHRRN